MDKGSIALLAKQRQRLLSLLLWRSLASCLLLLLTRWFYWPAADLLEQQYLMNLSFIWISLLMIQGLLWRYFQRYFLPQLFFQFSSDLVLIAALMFVTGGVHSPFVLLFGLVIVSAGTQARVLLVLSVAVLASAAYLSSVYLFSWLYAEALPSEATLKLLLQTSMFWLVGGVMALIARRHASLMLESHHVLQEHRDLKHLHRDLMAYMQEGVLVLDKALKVIDCNASFLKILNNAAYLNKDLSLLGDFPEALMTSLLSSKQQSIRVEWEYGEATYLLTNGFFSQHQDAYAWLTLVDITLLRTLEVKLAEQERLASLGRLSAMLAHEFRNPMQTIAQATELMSRLPEKTQGKVQKIVAE
ncbi:MAG: histidine kinase dimerization/phospho-acceptor domain-containing protein, partial [Mariprofundaceae bacterium]|nr:histidine kinase dimerization/phospho-acceptor domain-containing protein [Mariprofundaceae bacterium]